MKRLLLAFSLSVLAILRTDGFSPNLIQAPLFARPAPAYNMENVLSQRFHYLGKGRQCFVFESRDGKYVLKFFNRKYLQLPWYAFLFPKEKEKRVLRQKFYENSYEIAFREFGDQIVYLHLGSSDFLPTIVLKDKASSEYSVDLNVVPFVLQKKGALFYPTLAAIYQREGRGGLQREIDAYLEAVSIRIKKGIADGDRDVEHNWGYIDGKLFHLDPGRLYYDPTLSDPARIEVEWDRATHSLNKWLSKNYPF